MRYRLQGSAEREAACSDHIHIKMPRKARRVTTAEDHRELDQGLRGVTISEPPPVLSFEVVYPESYTSNGPDEDRLVETAENFQRQFSLLFPDRKPLLLCPVNECGVEKFVCTTLRPTLTVHPDVFDWDGSASFVANFLSLELLEPPVNLPRFLFSSTSVLQSQRATCFEFATLLCSLLLGSGFNAYCVSGYADKDVCLRDHSHQDCPALDSQIQAGMLDKEALENKYLQKNDWEYEFKSQFLVRREEAKAARLEKEKQQKETERRLADPLRGLRVHCWVLVLAGSNCVEENFFIEPLTGLRYDSAHHYFLGIESVWNHRNYYVNMQDCSGGCTDMVYDLEDLNMWEPILFSSSTDTMQDTEVEKKQRGHKMPRSWVGDIIISEEDLETRWPGGRQATRYREAELERFTPYLRPDGLVTRLTTYTDPEYSEVVMVKEWFRHRNDHMEEREVNKVDGFTTERFTRDRSSYLVSHRYQTPSADSVHDLEFRFGRLDGLVRRVVSPGEMTDVYGGRLDKLYYRHVVFNPPDPNPGKYQSREQQVFKVVECYERDRTKTGFEDLAKREFCTSAGRIVVTQHLEDHRPVTTTMTFVKPEDLKAKPEVLHGAQVCPCVKMFRKERLEELMKELREDEKEVISGIFMSKEEVVGIVVREREQYLQNFKLLPPSGLEAGAATAAGCREDTEQEQRLSEEEQSFLEEREADILSTLQIQLDKSDSLSPEDAAQLQHDCLTIFRQRLVEHFDLLQETLRKETADLQEKQRWYQTSTVEKTRRLEADFKDFCSKKQLWIRETQKRLHIFTKAAAQKYREVEQKLRRVPRLADFLWSL